MALLAAGSSDVVSNTLSVFSSALKQPVHIVALLLLVVLVYEIGRILTEGWRRVRPGARKLEQVASDALARPSEATRLARQAPGPLAERAVLHLAEVAREHGATPGGGAAGPEAAGADTAVAEAAAFEASLADYELSVQRRLDRTRLLVRAGPAVGLMGTLIPLAPGLAELGEGNFQALAADLQVAFAATVVGLLVGTTGFALTQVRARLYTEDLVSLERAIAAHSPEPSPVHHVLEVLEPAEKAS